VVGNQEQSSAVDSSGSAAVPHGKAVPRAHMQRAAVEGEVSDCVSVNVAAPKARAAGAREGRPGWKAAHEKKTPPGSKAGKGACRSNDASSRSSGVTVHAVAALPLTPAPVHKSEFLWQ
jgi:hypothetical protein